MAMPRSRGVRSLTTRPPMRMSPEVGSSRPAIIRRSVVFPEPDGPRRTRNSPSRLCRSTLLTAPTFPRLKTLVRFRVSTTAMPLPYVECGGHAAALQRCDSGGMAAALQRLFPLREDAPHLGVRRFHGGLGRHLV